MKKVKLPLEMASGKQVRSLQELKDNWDLEKVLAYYLNGRLLSWLKDRYCYDEAKKVEELENNRKTNIGMALCDIFGVEFIEVDAIDIATVEKKNRRLEKLRSYTADDNILKNVNQVAFEQNDIRDLINKNIKKIYLCENKFLLPVDIYDIEYIGIGHVIIENVEEITNLYNSGLVELENLGIKEDYSDIIARLENEWIDIDNRGLDFGKYIFENGVKNIWDNEYKEFHFFEYYKSENKANNGVNNAILQYYTSWRDLYFKPDGDSFNMQLSKAVDFYLKEADKLSLSVKNMCEDIYKLVYQETEYIKNKKLKERIKNIMEVHDEEKFFKDWLKKEDIEKTFRKIMDQGMKRFIEYPIEYYENKINIGKHLIVGCEVVRYGVTYAEGSYYCESQTGIVQEMLNRTESIINDASEGLREEIINIFALNQLNNYNNCNNKLREDIINEIKKYSK